MRQILSGLCALCMLTGCGTTRAMKVDNPVVGPPPPRIQSKVDTGDTPPRPRAASPEGTAFADATDPETAQSGVKQAGANIPTVTPSRIYADGEIVATVNRLPVFAGELLEPYRANLVKAREQLPPDQYIKVRESLVKKHLAAAIERKLLVYGLTANLKPEQIKMLEGHLDGVFNEELVKMMKEMGVTSLPELESEFEKRDLNLQLLKQAFHDQRMAQEFVAMKAHSSKDEPGRQEMLEYYREHAADYALPAKVRWQQILISYNKHGSRAETQRVLSQAANELVSGADFAEVARKYSDGPTAQTGGTWDWTTRGSLADPEIEDAIFTLPAGEVSPVIRTKTGVQIVAVVERFDADRVPFAEVQNDIKRALQEIQNRRQIEEAIQKLRDEAVITTIFDDEPNPEQYRGT